MSMTKVSTDALLAELTVRIPQARIVPMEDGIA
jgi:hypothetical protein